MLLARIITGSRLHGFSSHDSDYDVMEIYSNTTDFSETGKDEVQTQTDGVDLTRLTLGKFLERAMRGSHQTLDAMFAAETETEDHIASLRENFHAGHEVITVLADVIKDLAQKRDPKKNRHALRIAYNLAEIIETGRYTPELSEETKTTILSKLYLSPAEIMVECSTISGIRIK